MTDCIFTASIIYIALSPLLTHSSISEHLNFHCLPILCAGIPFSFLIQSRIVPGFTPRYSAASSIFIHLSVLLKFAIMSLRSNQKTTTNFYFTVYHNGMSFSICLLLFLAVCYNLSVMVFCVFIINLFCCVAWYSFLLCDAATSSAKRDEPCVNRRAHPQKNL